MGMGLVGRELGLKLPDGRDMAPTDGLWIIYLGYYGCFGLFSWTTVLLLPPWLFLVRYPVQQWKTYTVGPMVVIAASSWSIYDRLLDEWLLKPGLRCGFRRIDLYAADEFQAEDIDPGFQRMWPAPLVTQVQVELWASRRPNHAGRAVCRSDRSRTSMLSIPQVQLARRYQEPARVLKNQGLPAEAKSAMIC